MIQTTSKSSPSRSVGSRGNLTNSLLMLGSLGVGAYHGWHDAKGLPLPKENLEFWCTYGPTIVRAGWAGMKGALATGALTAGLGVYATKDDDLKSILGGAAVGGTSGVIVGGAVGTVWGGAKGAVQTFAGYWGGYLLGYLF